MISTGPATRVIVALEPVDMRRGFDGLHALVAHQIREDPRSGHLFVFTNTQRNRLKTSPRNRSSKSWKPGFYTTLCSKNATSCSRKKAGSS